ncbi:GLPGLI family protein [Chryseobacterium sp.]|uniref:GLPGLI family protein n=1 Tax=Chryseobacterium sp. TaxID=1871047 RepID=UPI003341337B
MDKIIFLFYILTSGILFSQKQIHIKYLNVRSPIANVYEDLYTDGQRAISKQDGNIMWTDPEFSKKTKTQDFYFISNIDKSSKDRNFFFTSFVKDNSQDFYFIYDKVPEINWKIDEQSSKKILGYQCIKATAIFRGSPITAYFTKELPYSVGPFKFFGLPGAILDVRVEGKEYDLWKAVKVDIDDKIKIDYNPEFKEYTKAKMQDYIKLKDQENTNFLNSSSVAGSTGKNGSVRLGIEKEFEWENETAK